jgi:hypothetical protein
MKLFKVLLATASATFLLGGLISTASARNYSVSSQTVRAQFRELNFRLPFFTTRCQVTLEGSLHLRTIAKLPGSSHSIGYFIFARQGPCSAGSATILTETLPWQVSYLAFSGPLPNIATVLIDIYNFGRRVREPFGINCLMRSSVEEPAVATLTREVGGTLREAELGGSIRTGEECFREVGTFTSDRGTVTVVGSTTRITIRLI